MSIKMIQPGLYSSRYGCIQPMITVETKESRPRMVNGDRKPRTKVGKSNNGRA